VRAETLTCRDFIAFIGSYLERELAEPERERFEAHLGICPDCRVYLDGYQTTVLIESVAFDPEAPVPETVPEGLVAAILDVRRRA